MRKSVFILLTVFMACLLCKESGNRPDAPWKFTNETFLTRGGWGGGIYLPTNGNVNTSIIPI